MRHNFSQDLEGLLWTGNEKLEVFRQLAPQGILYKSFARKGKWFAVDSTGKEMAAPRLDDMKGVDRLVPSKKGLYALTNGDRGKLLIEYSVHEGTYEIIMINQKMFSGNNLALFPSGYCTREEVGNGRGANYFTTTSDRENIGATPLGMAKEWYATLNAVFVRQGWQPATSTAEKDYLFACPIGSIGGERPVYNMIKDGKSPVQVSAMDIGLAVQWGHLIDLVPIEKRTRTMELPEFAWHANSNGLAFKIDKENSTIFRLAPYEGKEKEIEVEGGNISVWLPYG